jgi:hypothetical protein
VSTQVDVRPELRDELETIVRDGDFGAQWSPAAIESLEARRNQVLRDYEANHEQEPLARFAMSMSLCDHLYRNPDYRRAVVEAEAEPGESLDAIEVADMLNDLRESLAKS